MKLFKKNTFGIGYEKQLTWKKNSVDSQLGENNPSFTGPNHVIGH